MIYHTEPNFPPLTSFYLLPRIHSIMDVAIQVCGSGSSFRYILECSEQAVVLVDVIVGHDQITVLVVLNQLQIIP